MREKGPGPLEAIIGVSLAIGLLAALGEFIYHKIDEAINPF